MASNPSNTSAWTEVLLIDPSRARWWTASISDSAAHAEVPETTPINISVTPSHMGEKLRPVTSPDSNPSAGLCPATTPGASSHWLALPYDFTPHRIDLRILSSTLGQ